MTTTRPASSDDFSAYTTITHSDVEAAGYGCTCGEHDCLVCLVEKLAGPAPAPIAVTYSREKHAAHTGQGTGWDLERWIFASPTNVRPQGVPVDAEYHVGFLDAANVQHWVYVRRAPLSTERCPFCP